MHITYNFYNMNILKYFYKVIIIIIPFNQYDHCEKIFFTDNISYTGTEIKM